MRKILVFIVFILANFGIGLANGAATNAVCQAVGVISPVAKLFAMLLMNFVVQATIGKYLILPLALHMLDWAEKADRQTKANRNFSHASVA